MLDVGFKGDWRSLPAARMSVTPITQLSGSKLLHSPNKKGAPSTSEAARANMRTSLSFWQHNESNHLHHFCRSSEKSDSARMPRSFKQQRGILAAQRARNPGGEGSEGRGSRAGWPGARCREPAFQRGWCAAQRSGQGGERDHRGWPGAGCRAQGVQREGMDLRVLILTALSRACDGADSEMVEAPLCLASFLHSRGRRVQLGEPGHVRGACIGRRVHGACACEPFVDADPKISIPQIFSSDHAAHLFL
jgi:hypothetical protein